VSHNSFGLAFLQSLGVLSNASDIGISVPNNDHSSDDVRRRRGRWNTTPNCIPLRENRLSTLRTGGRFMTKRRTKSRRIRQSFADWSTSGTGKRCLFLRQQDYWIIRYRGVTAFLKATRGLYYLSLLLREPGREFHVLELVPHGMDTSGLAAVAANGGIRRGLYAAIPVLDAKAKAALKSRLDDLRQTLNEAERYQDLQRKSEAQTELKAIAEYLVSAVGSKHKGSADAERARCAVTKSIKKSIKKIADAIPSLGCHLAARIKTGYFCSYNPHPDRPVAWKL